MNVKPHKNKTIITRQWQHITITNSITLQNAQLVLLLLLLLLFAVLYSLHLSNGQMVKWALCSHPVLMLPLEQSIRIHVCCTCVVSKMNSHHKKKTEGNGIIKEMLKRSLTNNIKTHTHSHLLTQILPISAITHKQQQQQHLQ